MDKIFSARLDVAVLRQLDRLSRQLGITKKKLLEDMILRRAREMEQETAVDVWSETSGAWRRRESAATLRKKIRSEFEKSAKKHQN